MAHSAQFTIDNSTWTAAKEHLHSEPHNYAPSATPYTATLEFIKKPEGCNEVSITFTAQCEDCPAVTPSVTVPPCVNEARAPIELELTFNPPLPPGAKYDITWSAGNGPPITNTAVPVTAALATLTRSVTYAAGMTFYPSAVVTVKPPGQRRARWPRSPSSIRRAPAA